MPCTSKILCVGGSTAETRQGVCGRLEGTLAYVIFAARDAGAGRGAIMDRTVKLGLGAAVAIAVGVAVALRFGAGTAAKTGLDQLLANLPPGWRATHGAVSFDALGGNGRVDNLVLLQNGQMVVSCASVAASGVSGMAPNAPPRRVDRFTLTDCSGPHIRHLGQLTLSGVQVDNLLRLFDPSAYPNGKPASDALMPIVSSIAAHDLSIHLDLPPPARPVPGMPVPEYADAHVDELHEGAIAMRAFAVYPDFTHPLPPDQRWQFIAGLALGTDQGPVSVRNLSETVPNLGTIRIESETTQGMHQGRIAAAEVTGLAADIDMQGKTRVQGRITVRHIGLRDADFSRLLAVLPQIMADPQGNRALLRNTYHIGGYDMSEAVADFAHAALISLGSLAGGGTVAPDGTQDGNFTMRGFKITNSGRDIPPAARRFLTIFGMEDFNTDLDAAGAFMPAAGHLAVRQFDWTLHGLGALRMAGDFGGVKPADAPPPPGDPAAQLQAMRNVTINSASIIWDDASLTDRIFRIAAQTKHTTEAALRAQLAIPVASLAILMPEQPDAATQLNAFLDGKHKLEIDFKPPHPPVSFADVGAAGSAEKAPLLGITIKGD